MQFFFYPYIEGTSVNCRERYEAIGARDTGVYKRVHEDFEHRSTK